MVLEFYSGNILFQRSNFTRVKPKHILKYSGMYRYIFSIRCNIDFKSTAGNVVSPNLKYIRSSSNNILLIFVLLLLRMLQIACCQIDISLPENHMLSSEPQSHLFNYRTFQTFTTAFFQVSLFDIIHAISYRSLQLSSWTELFSMQTQCFGFISYHLILFLFIFGPLVLFIHLQHQRT